VETKTLIHLAKELGISPDYLLRPREDLSKWQIPFLWDKLYPTMESFVAAIGQKQPTALARLLQVLGFHDAIYIVGPSIVTEFHHYKKYIKPARRKQLENLWPLYASRNLKQELIDKSLEYEKNTSASQATHTITQSVRDQKVFSKR